MIAEYHFSVVLWGSRLSTAAASSHFLSLTGRCSSKSECCTSRCQLTNSLYFMLSVSRATASACSSIRPSPPNEVLPSCAAHQRRQQPNYETSAAAAPAAAAGVTQIELPTLSNDYNLYPQSPAIKEASHETER